MEVTKIMEIGDIFSVSGGCTVLAGSELPNEELSMDFLSEIKNKKVYVKYKDGLSLFSLNVLEVSFTSSIAGRKNIFIKVDDTIDFINDIKGAYVYIE